MTRSWVFVLALAAGMCGAQTQDAASAALARIRLLKGAWEGSLEWSGGRTGKGKISAQYHVTGYDSAVVEELIVDGVPSMMTVYHLDGSNLRMTHYCAAQNQPRLKASRIDLAIGDIDFDFVDATNLRSPDAPHVSGFKMHWFDANQIALTFLFVGGGQESEEHINLKRLR